MPEHWDPAIVAVGLARNEYDITIVNMFREPIQSYKNGEEKANTKQRKKTTNTNSDIINDDEGSRDSEIEATTKNSNSQSDEDGDVEHPAKKSRSETMPPPLDAVFVKNVICEMQKNSWTKNYE